MCDCQFCAFRPTGGAPVPLAVSGDGTAGTSVAWYLGAGVFATVAPGEDALTHGSLESAVSYLGFEPTAFRAVVWKDQRRARFAVAEWPRSTAGTVDDASAARSPICRMVTRSRVTLRRKREPDADEPRAAGVVPYFLAPLCACDTEACQELLKDHKGAWSEETIDELFRLGALPRIFQRRPVPACGRTACVFVEPCGDLTPEILVRTTAIDYMYSA